jgi:adenylate cyclase
VRSPLSLLLAIAFGLTLALGGGLLLFSRGLWLPVAAPALAGGAALVASVGLVVSQERAERALLTDLFARHVSAPVLQEILRHRETYLDEGRPRPRSAILTVMMSDLKGFTGASEKLDPGSAMDWINGYMDGMATLILQHGGVVDDYWGDGIKANFGVPEPRETEEAHARDAQDAVACALAMADAMSALNRTWAAQGLPTGRLRIGIHTGPAVVGSLGSNERLKYTSVGDTVNIASRLEALEKDQFDREASHFRILVSGATAERLGSRFDLVHEGSHRLRGREEPIDVWRVAGRRPASGGTQEGEST